MAAWLSAAVRAAPQRESGNGMRREAGSFEGKLSGPKLQDALEHRLQVLLGDPSQIVPAPKVQ